MKERLTIKGNICDIAQCQTMPCDGVCDTKRVYERLRELEDLQEKMHCENCRLKDTEFCRAVWKTKYNIKKEKWICKTMMEDDGFCSRFVPKENDAK